jgi:transcriptional regulator with GAF, ATPase, and Fis domain
LQHQRPLVIPVVEDETRFAQEIAYLRGQRAQSICALPLTTPRRRVGMLIAGSREPHTYDREEITFLSLVANDRLLSVSGAQSTTSTTNLHVVERDAITRALRECQGNKSKAAKQLGLSRTQLYVRLRKYQMT